MSMLPSFVLLCFLPTWCNLNVSYYSMPKAELEVVVVNRKNREKKKLVLLIQKILTNLKVNPSYVHKAIFSKSHN